MDNTAFIQIADSDGAIFSHACNNDFLIYTTTPAKVIIGTSNTVSCMTFDQPNSNTTIPTSLTLQGNLQFNNYMAMRGLRIDRTIDPQNPKNVTNTQIMGFNNTSTGLAISTLCNLMTLSSSNQEVMRLVATSGNQGRVGINNTNPSYTLDVNGGFRVQTGPVLFPNASISTSALNGVLSQWTTAGTSDKISITGCNVGIGTTNPGYTLDVNGGFRVQTGPVVFPAASISTSALNGTLSQWTNNGANDKIYITNSNVGIGTTTPAYPLDVVGNINCSGTISACNMGFTRNRLVNGNFSINNAAFTALATTQGGSLTTFDGFTLGSSITTGVITASNIPLTSSDAPFTAAGISQSLRLTATTAVTSYAFVIPSTSIQGVNMAGLNWGTTNGSPITLSFWMRTNLANSTVLDCTIRNGFSGSQWNNYSATLTVTNSGGWQQVSLAIPAPPNGSLWNTTTTGNGMEVQLFSKNTTTAFVGNTWYANGNGASGSTTAAFVWGTLNNYVEFTGIQLEKGNMPTPFETRPAVVESLLVGNLVLRTTDGGIGNICAGNIGIFRNRVINGDMRIAQRGTSANMALASGFASVDRFGVAISATGGVLNIAQNTMATSDTPFVHGFDYYVRYQATTAYTGLGWVTPRHPIEANNISDLRLGTTVASPFTVSYWFRSSTAGTFSTSFRGGTRSYIATFSYPNAAVWQYVTLTVPPVTSPGTGGAFGTGTGLGLEMYIAPIGSASWGVQPTFTWYDNVANGAYATSAVTNWAGTTNGYVDFTGVQLEKGAMVTPFEFRPYAIELQLCKRYFQVLQSGVAGYINALSSYSIIRILFNEMRATPSIMNNPISVNLSSHAAYNHTLLASTSSSISSNVLQSWGGFAGGCLDYASIALSAEL